METQSRVQPCYDDGALVYIYRVMKARNCIISLSHCILSTPKEENGTEFCTFESVTVY